MAPLSAIAFSEERYLETLHYAITARQLLNYHSVMAKNSEKRVSELLGIRDVIMADNLEYIASCERKRGKIFVFAHNEHLKRGNVKWQLGSRITSYNVCYTKLLRIKKCFIGHKKR